MKDRWITLVLAIGAFAAFYRFFVGSVQPDGEEHSRPLSTETRANGYFVLRHWLESEGLTVSDLRHRYDWLERAPGLPKRGNLLITTIPHKRVARWSELDALESWLRQGNAVLVAAGLFDTPEWGIPDTDTLGALYRLTGLRVRDRDAGEEADRGAAQEAPTDDASGNLPPPFERLPQPKRGVMRPVANHPVTQGVRAVYAESEYPAGTFDIVSPAEAPALALMTDEESGAGALWQSWVGDGTVLVSGYGSIFTNKMLAQADNAELAANIVARLPAPGGHVIFDDIHQGAASFYDEEAFFGDPRLHASFWWIVALWLVWVLGSTRLPPPAGRAAPVRERAFVQATGNFFARVLDRRRAALRLFANFFNDHRRNLGLVPDGQPLWSWMRSFGAMSARDVDRLEELHLRATAGRRVDLVDLHNRLQQLRKHLA